MCAGMSGHSARSLCFQSKCFTPLRDVAPYVSFVSSFCARVDEVAPPGRSASRAGASPRSERSLRLSALFLHIARGMMTSLCLGRSGSRKSSARG
ncbi:hypothetical protein F2Q70_00023162 [Brassica cretica]|uniref:Uncharacterized protein n=1 Tax=Brassica cretica TaxID=69181 RepID=A0A8S9GJ49_BRACR|nr:hypothetical protein F2Q70_00023162 [Brassica cretica]